MSRTGSRLRRFSRPIEIDPEGIAIAITSRLHQKRSQKVRNPNFSWGGMPPHPPRWRASRETAPFSNPLSSILDPPLVSCTCVDSGRGQTVAARALTSCPSRFYRLATPLYATGTCPVCCVVHACWDNWVCKESWARARLEPRLYDPAQ